MSCPATPLPGDLAQVSAALTGHELAVQLADAGCRVQMISFTEVVAERAVAGERYTYRVFHFVRGTPGERWRATVSLRTPLVAGQRRPRRLWTLRLLSDRGPFMETDVDVGLWIGGQCCVPVSDAEVAAIQAGRGPVAA